MVSAFSVPKARRQQKYSKNPGPGEYNPQKSPKHVKPTDPLYSFGKQGRKSSNNLVPGPGSYEYENAVFKYGSKMEPSYGFGSRLNLNNQSRVPGPGTYEPKKQIYSHIGGIVGKDLRDSLDLSKTPGPGRYDQENKFKQKAPVWSLSKSARDYSSGERYNLGPGQYEHTVGFKKVTNTAPSYNIAGNAQKLKYEINPVPGPGTYERPLMKSRGVIKIAQKLKDMEGLKVPGPGSYQQFKYDNDSWVRGSGRYSISKDLRIKQVANRVPGPGSYENKKNQIQSHKGKVIFSKDDKLKYDLGKVPGPGHYDLKPTFADVPKYLLPNHG